MSNESTAVQIADMEDLLVWRLSPADRSFVFKIVEGKTQVDAWDESHPDCGRESARRSGSRAMRRADIRQAIDEIQRETGQMTITRLKGMQPRALEVIDNAMKGQDTTPVQLNAAFAVLDRTGITARSVTALELIDARKEDSLDTLLSGDGAC